MVALLSSLKLLLVMSSLPSLVALMTSVVWSHVANICSTPRPEGAGFDMP